jgi:hypothetical protein
MRMSVRVASASRADIYRLANRGILRLLSNIQARCLMRKRVMLVCAVTLFNVIAPRPASAGAWSSFVAWLSNLDPDSLGLGTEFPLCIPQRPDSTSDLEERKFKGCVYPAKGREVLWKVSASLNAGPVFGENEKGLMYTVPAVLLAEWKWLGVYPAAGGGFIHVGGIEGGQQTRALLQARVTVPFKESGKGIRFDYNFIPDGFPAGAFQAGAPATGSEHVLGIAFVFLRKPSP